MCLSEATTATTCAFCGSSAILAQEENRNHIRPESLVPLEVGKERVQEALRSWIRGLWFRPNALRRVERFQARGVYLPAWTFDAQVHSDWSADAGHYYWVTQSYWTTVNGRRQRRTRRVRKVRWVPAWGDRDDAYDDLLVLASHAVGESLATKLGRFNLRDLVPYRPEYLAGWEAEEYRIDLMGGWDTGRARIEAKQQSRCAGDVPGDTHRFLSVRNHIRDVRWKHLLVPVWTVTYRYGGKSWPVVVHGQSGKVVGRAPLSWWKIGGLVLGIVAAVGLGLAALGLAGAIGAS